MTRTRSQTEGLIVKVAVSLAVAGVIGAVEMRVAIGRLESKSDSIEARVDRIERRLDGTAYNAIPQSD